MAQISCMGFNVMAYGTYGAEPPEARYPYVLTTIKDEMPDLIGIQEASQKKPGGCPIDWVTMLETDLGALGYKGVVLCREEAFVHPLQNTACGLIIFYKEERFDLRESGAHHFTHDPGRYFQWAKLFDRKYEKNILFTNTHFGTAPRVNGANNFIAGEAFRTVEAVYLANFWDANCDESTALFGTGDYNSEPRTTPQNILSGGRFAPSYRISLTPDDRGTVNVRAGHNALYPHLIDFCYVNPAAQQVLNYYPIVRRFETEADGIFAGYASDHRALMTYCDYLK